MSRNAITMITYRHAKVFTKVIKRIASGSRLSSRPKISAVTLCITRSADRPGLYRNLWRYTDHFTIYVV